MLLKQRAFNGPAVGLSARRREARNPGKPRIFWRERTQPVPQARLPQHRRIDTMTA